jgi:hypothetical protein
MINKNIENKPKDESKDSNKSNGKKPNETNGVYLTSHIRIFDPNTNEILLQKRADN